MTVETSLVDDALFRRRVLCVAAHPDDEVLGVGATLARHAQADGEVVVLILSDGEDAKVEAPASDHRRESALAAAKVIGTGDVVFCDFPDQRLDTVPFIELIKPIENLLLEFRPEIVYTHHGGDTNTDHLVTFKAAYAAGRPMTRFGASIERLLTFETPSSTDQAPPIGSHVFAPNCFVDVESTWDTKLRALACYDSEMVGGLHPRSFEYIDALARIAAATLGCGWPKRSW